MYSTKPFTPPAYAKFSLLPLRWSIELDLAAVVQERELAQALGEDLVVELDVAEGLGRGEEVHLGAAPVGVAGDLERRTGTPWWNSM